MAMKVIDESEYREFSKEIAEAEKDVMQRDKLLAQIYDRFERGLIFLCYGPPAGLSSSDPPSY